MNVIEIKSLSKRYAHRVVGIKELFVRTLQKDFSFFSREWALKEINLNVKSGSSYGILGHNGSGKSTLLSVISKSTTPEKGSCLTRGSIASLIELGAGFHPDLSGHENVYLYLSILGLSRKQINLKINKIHEFSELSTALHNRISTYSSGMLARLAFSTIIHSEPDILLIDEALEVGDKKFRSKCNKFMKEFKKKGGCLILASHDQNSIVDLCDEAIVLSEGKIIFNGKSQEAVNFYNNYYA